MTNSFYIGAYWGSRAQTLLEVKNKVIQTLKRLANEDKQFADWYEGGMSRKEALAKHIIINDSTIERLCLEQVRKGELNSDGFSKMGFLFGLWTGHEDNEASGISFSVGTASKWLTNSCVINIPSQGSAHENMIQREKAMSIINILVEIWNPDYAVMTSHNLNDQLGIGNKIGWITYQKFIKRPVKKLDGIIYNQIKDGHWFYPSTSNYNQKLSQELLKIKKLI
jgi:hypothetical protein